MIIAILTKLLITIIAKIKAIKATTNIENLVK
jgi:hypothetical protein